MSKIKLELDEMDLVRLCLACDTAVAHYTDLTNVNSEKEILSVETVKSYEDEIVKYRALRIRLEKIVINEGGLSNA